MNLNQIAVPSTDVARAAEFYRTLGLIQIVDARPDYARFECPDGDGTLSVERVDKVARGHGVVVYFECDERVLPDELKAAIVLFHSLLDERQRRLYAGLEALKIGHGGDVQIAELLGMDPATVARGRSELLAGDVEMGRVRRAGGGRKPAEKKRQRSSPASNS